MHTQTSKANPLDELKSRPPGFELTFRTCNGLERRSFTGRQTGVSSSHRCHPPSPPPPSLLSEHHSAFLAGESSSDGFQLCIDGVVMQLQMWLWCITLSRLGVQISIRKTLF